MRFNDKLKYLYGKVIIKSSIFNIIINNFELNMKKIVLLKFSVYLIISILFFNLYNIFIIF